ncbi:MAG: hypothetical protein J0M11_06625 [Anaerolineae bacterium]|nr:hypothetical protein [Anaerolineae bacterium]
MGNKAFALLLVITIGAVFLAWHFLPEPGATPQVGGSCPLTMTEIIASAQGDVYAMDESAADYVAPDFRYLTSYSVDGDSITNPELKDVPAAFEPQQADSASQQEAWQVFATLIPPADRDMVVEFNVFTDGYSNTLAAVGQLSESPTDWMLEVDVADLEDKDSLIFTLIHEYAHLLTLNSEQVAPDKELVDDPFNPELQIEKGAACAYYFTGTGCSYEDSYVNAFYNRFWVDLEEEWSVIDVMQYDEDASLEYYAALYAFYKEHQDQFVDDYSVTHPTEDIAESFTYFVFSPKPSGNSIKEQKINFFYEYPELVQLRSDILNGACSLE